MTPLSTSCALLVPLLWGVQYVIIKIGLTAFPPLFFVGLRFVVMSALLLPFVERPTRREIGPIILVSIFVGGLNFGLSFAGLLHGPAGASSVVNQLSAPFMVLLAWPLLGERPSPRVVLGVALAFAGVATMVIEPGATIDLVPTALIAGAGLSLAIGSVLTKRYGPFDPLKLLGWVSLFTVPQVLAASVLLEHGQFASLRAATAVEWSALAYTVVLGGITGFGLWFWLIARYSMAHVAPYALLQTVFAVAAGLAFLHERLTWSLVAGMVVCVGGVAITQGRPAPGADNAVVPDVPVGAS